MRAVHRRHRDAIAVGLAATVAAALLHSFGLSRRIELLALDAQFRRVNRIDASQKIVHIDIDDSSIDRVGDWPWKRDIQAGLIRSLHELGAATIVLDVVHPDPQGAYVDHPQLDRFADPEAPDASALDLGPEYLVEPDAELAQAIADAGNVYLASYFRTFEPAGEGPAAPAPTNEVERRIVEAFRQDIEADWDDIVRRVAASRPAAGPGDHALTVEDVRRYPLVALRRRAIDERVGEILRADPLASPQRVLEALCPSGAPPGGLRREIRLAWTQVRARHFLEERCPPVPAGLAGRIPVADEMTAPLFGFLGTRDRPVARGVGFVFFQPDKEGGGLRHLPLVVSYRGRLLKQLAFAVACDELGIRDEDLSIDDAGFLCIAPGAARPPLRIQLDESRRILVNWHRSATGWVGSFIHLPAAKVLEIYDCDRQRRDNDRRRRRLLDEAIRQAKGEEAYDGYRRELDRLLRDEREIRAAEAEGRAGEAEMAARRADLAARRRQIEADQASTVEFIRETWEELKAADRSDPAIAREYRRFELAARAIAVLPMLDQADRTWQARKQRLLENLRPVVAGRICFVGYTATAVADMVDTPVHSRLPGVVVHSNLLNTFLQGAFLRWARGWEQVLAVLCVGAAATWFACTRGPRSSFLLVAVLMVGLAGAEAFVLFRVLRYWLAIVTPLAVAFVAWAMVVMYRFLVSEREKRRFSKALAQYTSPAIARRIAEDLDRIDLSPVAGEVTCFFSDLADFTGLSEQYLDPAKTRSVLNPYLEAMSAVLHRHSALINKFMGDGIFAFFNCPVFPCASHARNACHAALDAQAALRELIARQRGTPLGPVFERLSMRIGLASGPVYVGDFGSENKLDYTCMGDTVNLAARLEPANKVFGTSILVSGATRAAAGDDLVFRHLGALQVKGKQRAIPVYDLIGRDGEVPSERRAYAERFEAAVALFQGRRWREAAQEFAALHHMAPGDRAVAWYLDLIRSYESAPPPDDWNGAIAMTEK